TGQTIRLRQLLAGGDGLEVHAEDRWDAGLLGTRVVVTVDLVEHSLDLVTVVDTRRGVVRGPVAAGREARDRGVGVDLRGEQVVDRVARLAFEDRVRGVLVRPRSTQPGL